MVVGGVLGPMQMPIVPEAWGYGDGEAPGGGQVCALVILFPPFGSDNSENEMQQTCR